jgi:hypothetical protein
VLERPRPVRPPRRIVTAFASPLNLTVGLAVALAAVVLHAIWLVVVAGMAYGALVGIGYVSAPTWAAETRDRTRERPRRDREPARGRLEG